MSNFFEGAKFGDKFIDDKGKIYVYMGQPTQAAAWHVLVRFLHGQVKQFHYFSDGSPIVNGGKIQRKV